MTFNAKAYPQWRHLLGRAIFAVTGWKAEGAVPDTPKMIVIAAPHTSNWDFFYLLAAAAVFRLPIHWCGKASLFRFPFAGVMHALGGIPIQRDKRQNMVQQIVQRLNDSSHLSVVVPPSGTRGKTEYWKSGFYHMANLAQVNILCGCLDFQRKTAILGLHFIPSGNIKADMNRIREFYQNRQGKYPQLASRIFLSEEESTKAT